MGGASAAHICVKLNGDTCTGQSAFLKKNPDMPLTGFKGMRTVSGYDLRRLNAKLDSRSTGERLLGR